MKVKDEDKPGPGLRAYEPPKVRKVKLVPDELAVAGCKSTMITSTLCRRGPGQAVSRFRGS
jgi:hypothetical protein